MRAHTFNKYKVAIYKVVRSISLFVGPLLLLLLLNVNCICLCTKYSNSVKLLTRSVFWIPNESLMFWFWFLMFLHVESSCLN